MYRAFAFLLENFLSRQRYDPFNHLLITFDVYFSRPKSLAASPAIFFRRRASAFRGDVIDIVHDYQGRSAGEFHLDL